MLRAAELLAGQLHEALPALVYGAGTLVQVAAAAPALLELSRDSSATRPRLDAAQLTVLQPILGGDPTLEECLVRTAAACAPTVSFQWLVDGNDTVGQAAAERALARLEPDARAAVRLRSVPPIDALARGAGPTNPKSAKLGVALREVDTPLVAVLDDDTTVGLEHLSRAARALQRGADLYTGLPSYRAEGRALGSALLAGFVNASGARTYLAARRLGAPATINGMFWVTRAVTLRELGGFAAVQHELCDDLAVAQLYLRAGRRIVQGATAQVLLTRDVTLGEYARKMHRWCVFARVLLARTGWSVRVPLLLFGIGLPIVLTVALCLAFTGTTAAVSAAAILLLRHGALSTLLAAAREPGGVDADAARLGPFASVAAEVLLPLHALHALLVPTIRWRTHRYRVAANGEFKEASEG